MEVLENMYQTSELEALRNRSTVSLEEVVSEDLSQSCVGIT